MAELVDAGDSKSPAARRGGSIPSTRTIPERICEIRLVCQGSCKVVVEADDAQGIVSDDDRVNRSRIGFACGDIPGMQALADQAGEPLDRLGIDCDRLRPRGASLVQRLTQPILLGASVVIRTFKVGSATSTVPTSIGA